MRLFIILILAIALSSGCGSREDQDRQLDMKSLQKTVGEERLSLTLSQVADPSMDKSIMEKSDAEIIEWLKSVDVWTHQVLSSTVTGEMDEAAMRVMRSYLTHAYTPEAADKLIAYFYRHDPRTGTYQAISTPAMLGLRSEWGSYELRKDRPSGDQYYLLLNGRTTRGVGDTFMHHRSQYQVEGDRLIIREFTTIS